MELRSPQLNLSAVSRITHPFASLPATGWTQSFESVSGELFLPPGHRLVAVLGADQSPSAWLDRWRLWSLFGVLVVTVFAYWVTRQPLVTALGALGLLLTYQAQPSFIWGWANLIAAVALARAEPAGRLANIARGYRMLSFVLLALALVSFAWTEVRHSIYPQLEYASGEFSERPVLYDIEMPAERVAQAAASDNAPAAPAMEAPAMEASVPESPPPPPPKGAPPFGEALKKPTAADAYSRSATIGSVAGKVALPAYAPGTLLQAGPGVPNWDYGVHPFSWSGPVDPDQTVRFIVLGPIEVALWRIAGVLLLVTFFVQLARTSWGRRLPWPDLIGRGSVQALLLLGCVLAVPPPAHAQSLPTAELLNQLQARLIEPPHCAPTCAEMLGAHIHITGERIEVELQTSALTPLAVALPTAGDRWQIDSIAVDGKSSLAVTREADAGLWLPVEPGVHFIRIEARLSGDSVHLAFPMTPRRITVDAPRLDDCWNQRRSTDRGCTRSEPPGLRTEKFSEHERRRRPGVSPFVSVVREFRLGLGWSIATSVQRISPSQAAFTIAVPLVPGESVLSEGLQVNPDNTVLVGLSAGQQVRTWNSSLKREDHLSVRLPVLPPRSGSVALYRHAPMERALGSLPATLPENPDATPWVFEYHPRPGEVLDLTVSEPPAVAGETLAIDRVRQRANIGQRSTEESLEFHYRSTQGGRQNISFSKDAIVTEAAL